MPSHGVSHGVHSEKVIHHFVAFAMNHVQNTFRCHAIRVIARNDSNDNNIREATKYNDFFYYYLSLHVYMHRLIIQSYIRLIFFKWLINVQMLHGKSDFMEILKNSDKYRFENNLIEL